MIGPLGYYEKLDISAHDFVELPYSLRGERNSDCENSEFNGTFDLKENIANSFFVLNESLRGFEDNNDKAIDGVNIRYDMTKAIRN